MTTITKYKVSATIAAGETSATAYSIPIRGKILAVGVHYPTNTCTVDLDSDGEAVAQKILDLAAANTDVVRYPRKPVEDHEGTGIEYASGYPIYEPFIVYGRLKLSLATGTAEDTVKVDLIVEEN